MPPKVKTEDRAKKVVVALTRGVSILPYLLAVIAVGVTFLAFASYMSQNLPDIMRGSIQLDELEVAAAYTSSALARAEAYAELLQSGEIQLVLNLPSSALDEQYMLQIEVQPAQPQVITAYLTTHPDKNITHTALNLFYEGDTIDDRPALSGSILSSGRLAAVKATKTTLGVEG